MKIRCKNGNIIDHWYDKNIRQSVTQVLDPDGNQVGDAEYSGNRTSAKYAKEWAIKANGGREPIQKCDACDSRGFLLVDNYVHGTRIERCDTCEKFKSDKAAIEYVYAIAVPAVKQLIQYKKTHKKG